VNGAVTRPVRVRLTMACGPGPEVDAWPTPVPGLVIHRTFGQPGDAWTITQQHSGVALAACLPSPEHALGCAMELAGLADWTGPVDYDATGPAAHRIVTRWGAGASVSFTSGTARAAGAIL